MQGFPGKGGSLQQKWGLGFSWSTQRPAYIPAVTVREPGRKVKKAVGFLHGRCTAIRSWLPRHGIQVVALEPRVTGPWEASAITHDLITEDGVWFLGASVQKWGSHRGGPACSFSHRVQTRPGPQTLPFVPMSVGQVICPSSRLICLGSCLEPQFLSHEVP